MDSVFREAGPAFAAEAAAFLAEHWPSVRQRGLHRAAVSRWYEALVRRGWTVPGWPKSAGGPGWSLAQRFVWERSLAFAEAPAFEPFAVEFLGPLIHTHAHPALGAQYLDDIRTGRSRWADGIQGLSVHRLAASGRRRGQRHRLDGVLTGVQGLEGATHVACLAALECTGLGLFLVSLDAPGVERLDAGTLEFANVDSGLIGPPGDGLKLAQSALTANSAPVATTAAAEALLVKLRRALHETADGHGRLLEDDPDIRRQVAGLEVQLTGLQALEANSLAQRLAGAAPGPVAVALRVRAAELLLAANEALIEALGYYALPHLNAELLDNEGPIGPDYALPAIRGMLAHRSGVDCSWGVQAGREWLAAWLVG